MLHFVRFGRWALRFGELLMNNVRLHLRVLILDTLILSDGHLVRRNLDASTGRVDRLLVILALASG